MSIAEATPGFEQDDQNDPAFLGAFVLLKLSMSRRIAEHAEEAAAA